ncbi:MAG: 50S ribosomal protein L22 [Candidatus Woesearchaeota archaeon]|jgi:large subunit ribosomal protein L22|nr:50S ribosomal protein L22 [Candidatus Woesearchaeota archaeon]|tara:strand:- start:13605 stop:14156 length:552 start_codon:yes stop_codon:yes gene_type:complete
MKGYTFKNYNKEHMARSVGIALPVSFKQSIQICNFIKNRNVSDAKKLLNMVVERKTAIPFTRFNSDMGHKKKIGPGRYPEKTSREFIKLIEDVEANAQFKGLNTSNLIIAHISANKAGKAWHYGRQSRRKMKRTNIEIFVEEKSKKTGENNNKGQNKSVSKVNKTETKKPEIQKIEQPNTTKK